MHGKELFFFCNTGASPRTIAREFYDQHNGRVDKSALARELQVDRSTVTIWVNSFDLEVESGQ